MSEIKTIARPYAKAIFDLALEKSRLKEWSLTLNNLAMVAADNAMQGILGNPLLSKQQLIDFFIDIGGASLNDQEKRLISLLALSKRLNLLPAIAKLFEEAVANRERTMNVKVVSAYPLDQARLLKMTHALQNKLKRQVTIQCAVDHQLLGGAIIYAGDQVIDGSLRTKLKKLNDRLCS